MDSIILIYSCPDSFYEKSKIIANVSPEKFDKFFFTVGYEGTSLRLYLYLISKIFRGKIILYGYSQTSFKKSDIKHKE